MKNYKIWLFILGVTLVFLPPACTPDEDIAELGAAPTPEDATFTYEYDADNPNIVHFTNTSPGFILKWDLGNGAQLEGNQATGIYPLKGDYTVTLTIYTRSGSTSNSQVVNIAETDPSLLDREDFNLLTGGVDQIEGKTWVIDSTRAGHMGVGPSGGTTAEWWQAPPLDKAGLGMYDDEVTFKLLDFVYVFDNNGDVFANGASAGDLGGDPANGDQKVFYTPPADLNWAISEDGDGNKFLTITKGSFFGFYTGVSTYQILTLTENELYVRFLDSKNPDLAWYQRLIPKGYTPPPPPPSGTVLPIDFETEEPDFVGFGGNSFEVVDNPDMSDGNPSARVGKTVHGNETWGGIETILKDPLDFSTNNIIKVKVWSPVEGIAKLKLEDKTDNSINKEIDVNMTTPNTWQELWFDVTDFESDTYDKLVLFFDFNGPEGNTFYFDDVQLTQDVPPFSVDILTGGGTKAWRLKPIAGALAVGPDGPGSAGWWSNSAGDVTGRDCWFDDEYIFSDDGTYTYDSKGVIYAETYMGVSEGCTDESELPADAQAWGSGTHAFTFTSPVGVDPARITVTGTGAFIALPKAYNDGEYSAGPPQTDGSVTYDVLSYEDDGVSETLVLTLNYGPGWWTYTLEAVQ